MTPILWPLEARDGNGQLYPYSSLTVYEGNTERKANVYSGSSGQKLSNPTVSATGVFDIGVDSPDLYYSFKIVSKDGAQLSYTTAKAQINQGSGSGTIVEHDDSLKGVGIPSQPLGVADKVLGDISYALSSISSVKAEVYRTLQSFATISYATATFQPKLSLTEALTALTAEANSSTVNLTKTASDLLTGTSTSHQEALPVASASYAGVMNPSQVQGLEQAIADIATLKGQQRRIAGHLGTAPTQAELTTYWEQYVGSAPADGATIVNLDQDAPAGHAWTWLDVEGTEQWQDRGIDTVAQATNTTLGVSKGSTEKFKSYAEPDGTWSTNGLDELEAVANNAYQKPTTGIPKTDLDQSVQASLSAADSAIQSLSGSNGNATATSGSITFVESISGSKTGTEGIVTSTRKTITIPSEPNNGTLYASDGQTSIFTANQSGNSTLTKTHVGLSNVTNEAQFTIASNNAGQAYDSTARGAASTAQQTANGRIPNLGAGSTVIGLVDDSGNLSRPNLPSAESLLSQLPTGGVTWLNRTAFQAKTLVGAVTTLNRDSGNGVEIIYIDSATYPNGGAPINGPYWLVVQIGMSATTSFQIAVQVGGYNWSDDNNYKIRRCVNRTWSAWASIVG